VQEEVQHEQESVVVVVVVAHDPFVVVVHEHVVAVVVVAHDPFVVVVHERVVAVVVVHVTHIVLGLPLLGLQRVKKYDTTQQIGVPSTSSLVHVTHQP
jgi:hypothetical protein